MKKTNLRKAASLALALSLTVSSLFGCAKTSDSGNRTTQSAAESAQSEDSQNIRNDDGTYRDGEYQADVTLTGGSGKASVESPCTLTVSDGKITAHIVWSSNHYDYMIVDGEKYEPVNTDGNSAFDIPVAALDEEINVTADTTAMSTAHEIEYTLTFTCNPDSSTGNGAGSDESASETGSASGSQSLETVANRNTDISSELTCTGTCELSYATQFAMDYYDGGYTLITISDGTQYLVVPENASVPSDLDSNVTALQQPLNNVYLAASAVMDMYVSMDAVSLLGFTGTEEDDWYIDEAKAAMEAGTLKYAGKYSAPDYETLLASRCSLAIENTMIYHTPEVQEQLIKFGIPVLVDHSSYETDPLGRMEWIRLYGTLMGKEDAAEAAFTEQENQFESYSAENSTGKKVAFFYITNDGQANVRKGNDYLAKIINLAGGEYVFSDLGADDDSSSSTMSMTMEEFYAGAKDADYIIYNSAIEGELSDMNALLKESELLKNFKAVQDGNVYCTSKNLYQSSMQLGGILEDISHMLNGEDDQMKFIYKLN